MTVLKLLSQEMRTKRAAVFATVLAVGPAEAGEGFPPFSTPIESILFLDFLHFHSKCNEARFFGDDSEDLCSKRDLIGKYLNVLDWCTDPSDFMNRGWTRCAQLSPRFPFER